MAPKHLLFVELNESSHGLAGLLAAHKQGYFITFVTAGFHYYSERTRALAEPCIDRMITKSTYEHLDELVETIRLLHQEHPLDGVYASSDFEVETAAFIAESLGIRGCTRKSVHAARNKYEMRKTLLHHQVPQPGFALIDSLESIPAATAQLLDQNLSFPFVLKPVDSSASDGVKMVHSLEEIESFYQHHLSDLHFRRGFLKAPAMILEEYVSGELISVELVITPTGVEVLGLTDRELSEPPYFVELGGSFPATLVNQEEVIEVALQSIQAVGLEFGPCHVELVNSASGPQLIEINPRLIGSTVNLLISASRNTSVIEQLIRMYAGDVFTFGSANEGVGVYRKITAPQAGTLVQLTGQERAANLPGVLDVKISRTLGSIVKAHPESNMDLIGVVTVFANTKHDAQAVADQCIQMLQFTVK